MLRRIYGGQANAPKVDAPKPKTKTWEQPSTFIPAGGKVDVNPRETKINHKEAASVRVPVVGQHKVCTVSAGLWLALQARFEYHPYSLCTWLPSTLCPFAESSNPQLMLKLSVMRGLQTESGLRFGSLFQQKLRSEGFKPSILSRGAKGCPMSSQCQESKETFHYT